MPDIEKNRLSSYQIEANQSMDNVFKFLNAIAPDGYTKKLFGKLHSNHPKYPHYYHPIKAAYDILSQLYAAHEKCIDLKKLLLSNLSEEESALLFDDSNG